MKKAEKNEKDGKMKIKNEKCEQDKNKK